MKLGDLKYLLSLPPRTLAAKLFNRPKRRWNEIKSRRRAKDSDLRVSSAFPQVAYSYIDISRLDPTKIQAVEFLHERYLSHRMDLLGSGWVKHSYDSLSCGLEDHQYDMNKVVESFDHEGYWLEDIIAKPYLPISRQYWQEVSNTNAEYKPIDWQKDFKSGFRWSARSWFRDQTKYSKGKIGVDIKVPWELSRLQHLTQLAIFAIKDEKLRLSSIREFKCQVLDFFASNPPGWGVNFSCAMDIGIRAANLLVAYDLFSQLDNSNVLDKRFADIFSKNIYLHGRHILSDLEYREGLTSNHYLGNICGLLFIANYLEVNPEINQWLAFSIQELNASMQRQFFADGTNFEGSTSYHRLSGEMILYSTALVLGLKNEKLQSIKDYSVDPWPYQRRLKNYQSQFYYGKTEVILPMEFFQKLYKAGLFSHYITKDSGCIAQFGDNDSGRFFRFSPNGIMFPHEEAMSHYQNLKNYDEKYSDEWYWDENDINHGPFISACSALFHNQILSNYEQKFPLESTLIKSLSNGREIHIDEESYHYEEQRSNHVISPIFKYQERTVFKASKQSGVPLCADVNLYEFPDAQIYIFRSKRLYLAIAGICNPMQHHTWGHVHNDKLSIELAIDGEDLLLDPGTYLYTPLPKVRNRFRSVTSHNTLVTKEGEQNKWSDGSMGLFKLYQSTRLQVLKLNSNQIVLELNYRNVRQIRSVKILEEQILIEDYSTVPFTVSFKLPEYYSNGYGKLVK